MRQKKAKDIKSDELPIQTTKKVVLQRFGLEMIKLWNKKLLIFLLVGLFILGLFVYIFVQKSKEDKAKRDESNGYKYSEQPKQKSVQQENYAKGIITDQGNGYKKYSNQALGFSFDFPAIYAVTYDQIAVANNQIDQSYQNKARGSITLEGNGSKIKLIQNTLGFGSECSNPIVIYDASFVNNKFKLDNRQVSQQEEIAGNYYCGYVITAKATINDDEYLFLEAGDKNNIINDEKAFVQIASSLTVQKK